jgi:CubicO group peptidase (beta-lactamase class C family)
VKSGGLSPARLQRMHEVLAGYVGRGELPGFITLVDRHGETVVDAVGQERDAIFPIASMTKPIAAVGAMILVEEAILHLDDPLNEFLPELSDLRVLRHIKSPTDDTVPARRPITLRDLLTFRLGTGAVFAEPGTYPIQAALDNRLGFRSPSPASREEFMQRVASLPLVHQPGEAWMYHTGSEILGVLIARAAKRSMGDFFAERIFSPLGMKDTAFFVPAGKHSRLVLPPSADRSGWTKPPAFESAGGGLASTADDYLRFSRMMLNHGELEGKRILARPAVEAMTVDHLTPEQKARSPFREGYWDNHGWGFGMTVIMKRFDGASTPGTFGWDGGSGTSWRADPVEDMTTILLTASPWPSAYPPPIYGDFRTLAYAAIDD